MAQRLLVIIGLAEKQGLLPSTHVAVQTLSKSSSKVSAILCWSPWTIGMSTAHFNKYKQILTQIKCK